MSGEGWRARAEAALDVPLFPVSLLHELTHYVAYRVTGTAAEIHLFDADRRAYVSVGPSRREVPPRVNLLSSFAPLALLPVSVPAAVGTLRWLDRGGGVLALGCFVYAWLLVLQSFPSENDIRTLRYSGWSTDRVKWTVRAVNVVAFIVIGLFGAAAGSVLAG